jgi:ABC-type transporter Mla MlaB component
MIKVYNWQEIGKRALSTFWQAGIALLIASGFNYTDISTLKVVVIGGAAAVLSFIKNVRVQTLNINKLEGKPSILDRLKNIGFKING